MQIDVNKIVIQPNHPVHTHKPIKHLENKRNTSQGMPLLIDKHNKFLLYTGEITFRKAKLNGLKKINCNVREGIDKSRLEELNLSEIYFSGLKLPTEIAKDFINYRKRKNMSQQELSRRTKITPGSIHHYESLLKKLDPKLANELDQGKLTFKEARCIADLDDFDIQNKVAKPFIEGKISSVYIEKIVSLVKKNNYTQNLDKIIEDIISGTYIFNNKVEKKIPAKREHSSNMSIEHKIIQLASELESITNEEIPEYRRLRLISSLKILDSRIKASLNHINETFMENVNVYTTTNR